MKKYFIIFASALYISFLDTQKVHYAHRFRNFSVESETNSIYIINMTIYQHGMEHWLSACVNITEDVPVKAIHVIIYRCRFEKAACENFQSWKFNTNLNRFMNMKNQLWTPILKDVIPPLNFSHLKKNIYCSKSVTLNAQNVVAFYPDITKYYWQIDCLVFDPECKKGVVLKFDFAIMEYVERADRKRKQH